VLVTEVVTCFAPPHARYLVLNRRVIVAWTRPRRIDVRASVVFDAFSCRNMNPAHIDDSCAKSACNIFMCNMLHAQKECFLIVFPWETRCGHVMPRRSVTHFSLPVGIERCVRCANLVVDFEREMNHAVAGAVFRVCPAIVASSVG
jgi:hypothetical protein